MRRTNDNTPASELHGALGSLQDESDHAGLLTGQPHLAGFPMPGRVHPRRLRQTADEVVSQACVGCHCRKATLSLTLPADPQSSNATATTLVTQPKKARGPVRNRRNRAAKLIRYIAEWAVNRVPTANDVILIFAVAPALHDGEPAAQGLAGIEAHPDEKSQ